MTQYEVSLSIDQAGLAQIAAAGMVVGLARSTTSTLAAPLPVAWLEFQPIELNVVTWTDDFQAYGAGGTPTPGFVIECLDVTNPLPLGATVIYQDNQLVVYPTGGPSNGFALDFQELPLGSEAARQAGGNQSLGLGLAQPATVNNVSCFAAINLVELDPNSQADVVPQLELSIFLTPNVGNGILLDQLPADALTVPLNPDQPTMYFYYNDSNGTFFMVHPPAHGPQPGPVPTP